MMNREEIISYLKNLRGKFIIAFESLETKGKFQRKKWDYNQGSGGGEIGLLRGEVFEKAAINFSGLGGDSFPGKLFQGPFFATGVSLISHMRNPKTPTSHFNIRYIEAEGKKWVGGGFDLTPMGFPYDEDTRHFHAVAKKALDPFGDNLYEKFSKWAKEYFTVPHYREERGVGGLFFDHYHSGNFEKDLKVWQSVGDHFLEAIMPILKRRVHEPYTEEERLVQLRRRARYVEFILLYDRGTKFGFESGGNPEAILCSMPPLVAW